MCVCVGVFGAAVLLPQAEEPAAVVTEVKKAAPAPVSPPRSHPQLWLCQAPVLFFITYANPSVIDTDKGMTWQ